MNIYNKNKFRRKLDFTAAQTIQTITYAYKATITLVRSDNVDSVVYTINGTTTEGKIEVDIGDVLIATIVKSAAGTSQIVLEELIYS
jgi:hypothetical protein